jgi:hypothetical protein
MSDENKFDDLSETPPIPTSVEGLESFINGGSDEEHEKKFNNHKILLSAAGRIERINSKQISLHLTEKVKSKLDNYTIGNKSITINYLINYAIDELIKKDTLTSISNKDL